MRQIARVLVLGVLMVCAAAEAQSTPTHRITFDSRVSRIEPGYYIYNDGVKVGLLQCVLAGQGFLLVLNDRLQAAINRKVHPKEAPFTFNFANKSDCEEAINYLVSLEEDLNSCGENGHVYVDVDPISGTIIGKAVLVRDRNCVHTEQNQRQAAPQGRGTSRTITRGST